MNVNIPSLEIIFREDLFLRFSCQLLSIFSG